jgi:hypothetical protein
MVMRNRTLFQIKRGDPDESAMESDDLDGPVYPPAAQITKSRSGGFPHYYRNLGKRLGMAPVTSSYTR